MFEKLFFFSLDSFFQAFERINKARESRVQVLGIVVVLNSAVLLARPVVLVKHATPHVGDLPVVHLLPGVVADALKRRWELRATREQGAELDPRVVANAVPYRLRRKADVTRAPTASGVNALVLVCPLPVDRALPVAAVATRVAVWAAGPRVVGRAARLPSVTLLSNVAESGLAEVGLASDDGRALRSLAGVAGVRVCAALAVG